MSKYAVQILTSNQITTTGGNLKKVTIQAKEELRLLNNAQVESTFRALRFGVLMFMAKEQLGHGKFMPWQKEHFEQARTQCGYYMRLTERFVEDEKVTADEVLALTNTPLDAEPTEAVAIEARKKASEFVGSSSLNELLRKHGIKDAKKKEYHAPKELTADEQAEAELEMARAEHADLIGNLIQYRESDARLKVSPKDRKEMLSELVLLTRELRSLNKGKKSKA